MDPKMEGMTRPKLPKNLSKKDFKKLVSDPALHSWEAKGESLKDVETLLEGRKTKIKEKTNSVKDFFKQLNFPPNFNPHGFTH